MTMIHVCTGCGTEKMLTPNEKHYCNCNPSAKFVFMVKVDKLVAERIVAFYHYSRDGRTSRSPARLQQGVR